MGIGKVLWLVIALASSHARAEITFLRKHEIFCSAIEAAIAGHPVRPDIPITSIETPRLRLGFVPFHFEGYYPTTFTAVNKKTGEKLGTVSLLGHGTEELAALLFPQNPAAQDKVVHMPIFFEEHKGQGFGTEAKYALMRYAFEVAGLEGVVDSISVDNVGSIATHEKLGFHILERSEKKVHYGITKAEFETVRKKFGNEEEKDFLPRRRPQ